ncbi:unnamed protein product [Cuscuta epithymum]|uniref:Cytochrome P450 n=1 Tax=Cuscuta epithymum TaxID=186058 RepID=A0AAV0G0Y6_9ASTE|nr:unnamed protein product [Cuscuta epithymum]
MGIMEEEVVLSGGISLLCMMVMMISTAAAVLGLGYVGRKLVMIWKKAGGRNNVSPTNWPVVGMLPGILQNVYRIHEYVAEILIENGGTFEVKGSWLLPNLNFFLTCDPANINYIFCQNFKNYPHGPHLKRIFDDAFGEGIINTDNELWELHRKTTTPIMNNPRARARLEKKVADKIRHGLLPLLERHVQKRDALGMKQVFWQVTFDIACIHLLERDPCTLDITEEDDNPFLKALQGGVNALLYRHFLPEWSWKLQKWVFGVDREEKLTRDWKVFGHFINPILSHRIHNNEGSNSNFSILLSHINAHKGMTPQFLTDTFRALLLTGSESNGITLTWLFWLLAKNPLVEAKILDEIRRHQKQNDQQQVGKPSDGGNGNYKEQEEIFIFKEEECQKLTYLHAAVCETLRLFPPLPLNHKVPTERDVLPSGHVVTPNTKIIVSYYATGRMVSVWGEDCMEFKPERWISPAGGGILHQPSYKFPAFGSGPRSCIGREMSFTVIKMIAATILCHYRYELAEPCPSHHQPETFESIVLEMKDDLKVFFTHR